MGPIGEKTGRFLLSKLWAVADGGLGTRGRSQRPGLQVEMSPFSRRNSGELEFFGAAMWGFVDLEGPLETQPLFQFF